MNQPEGFEPLKDCEERRYMINQKGELYSVVYKKLLKPQTKEDGYLFYNLTGYTVKKAFIHRLLMKQYVPNPDNLPEVDHIDRNKQNNDLSNLRWCDRKTNANNKESSLANLTEEQNVKRAEDLTEYKRVWAEKNRREKGVPIREKHILPKEEEHQKRQEYLTNLSQEEKERRLKLRRENRKELTEEQKEKARERARKQREKSAMN